MGFTLLLKVDQIFIILVDLDVGKGPPGILNLLGSHGILGLLSYLSSSFLVAAPSPLDLNGGDMVHRESMILEESSRQRHLVRCLDQTGAEVTQTLVLVLCHHVEGRG